MQLVCQIIVLIVPGGQDEALNEARKAERVDTLLVNLGAVPWLGSSVPKFIFLAVRVTCRACKLIMASSGNLFFSDF